MTLRINKKAAFAFSALAIGVAGFSTQVQAATQIQTINVKPVSSSTTQLRITFEGTPVTPVAYQQTGSNQLVLDFNQTTMSLPRKTAVDIGSIQDMTALSNGSTTRLLFNLTTPATYSTRLEGNQLVVDVINVGASSSSVQAATTGASAAAVAVSKANPLLNPSNAQINRGYDGIAALDFSAKGVGGDIAITLTNEAVPVDVQRQGNKLVIRTSGATIPRHLLRRLNASGLVTSIDAKNQGQNGVLTVTMSGDFEYQAYQSGTQLHVSVKPPELLREPTLEEKVYRGDPLSMEFQDVPVRTVLDVLSRFTGQNIVSTDNVSGNMTLRLMNVPWDQALDIILKSRNLDKRVNGNVMLVAPATELTTRELEELRAKNDIKDLAPLRTEYIRLNYAKAEDVNKLIQEASKAQTTTGTDVVARNARGGGLLSPRGSIIVDARTNTLIIKDTSDSINNVRAMLEKIDISVSQVMIEARIVNATDGFAKQLGVQWGFAHDSQRGQRGFQIGGSRQNSLWAMRNTEDGKLDLSAPNSLNLDLAAGSLSGFSPAKIAFGLLNISNSMLDLELSALQADNRGETISAPKILTTDKQTARISSGTQIPYQRATSSGATAVEYKAAELSLEVTPNITPEGKIGLKLDIKNGIPGAEGQIMQDSINTEILLEDGQTVVLGGIFRNTIANRQTKVPFLGDLPYVGRLFRNETRQNDKQELLIFITPKIVDDGIGRIN